MIMNDNHMIMDNKSNNDKCNTCYRFYHMIMDNNQMIIT